MILLYFPPSFVDFKDFIGSYAYILVLQEVYLKTDMLMKVAFPYGTIFHVSKNSKNIK